MTHELDRPIHALVREEQTDTLAVVDLDEGRLPADHQDYVLQQQDKVSGSFAPVWGSTERRNLAVEEDYLVQHTFRYHLEEIVRSPSHSACRPP